jgi:hypothetical protein
MSGIRDWRDITSSDENKLAACVDNGSIWTSDSGTTWVEQTMAGTRDWNKIRSSSDGSILCASVINEYLWSYTNSVELGNKKLLQLL